MWNIDLNEIKKYAQYAEKYFQFTSIEECDYALLPIELNSLMPTELAFNMTELAKNIIKNTHFCPR